MPAHNTSFQGGIPVSTTDGTATTLITFGTKTDHAYHVKAVVVAKEIASGNEAASYEIIGTFLNDGGTLALVGSLTAAHTGEITSGWSATMDASGTDIRVRVTGASSTNVKWRGHLEIDEISDEF